MLWLPEDTRLELQVDALARSQMVEAKRIEAEFRKLDPRISIVLAKPEADDPRIKPGYWHLIRRNPGYAMTVLALTHDDGSYREPGDWLIEWFKRHDSWDSRVAERIRKEAGCQTMRRKYEAELEKEAAADNAAAAVRAARRVAGEGGMTARRWGRGRVKGVVGA